MGQETRVYGNLRNTDKVMRDSFWIGLWPGIDNEMLDYMVKILEKTIKRELK